MMPSDLRRHKRDASGSPAAASIRPVEDLAPDALRLAFVCTANQFRSALAEAVCAHLLRNTKTEVSSFGVLDLPSSPASRLAVEFGRSLDLDLSRHRSRPLRHDSLVDMSLVVGFEHSHVAAAIIDGGAAPDRTFMLTELVQLLLAAGAGSTLVDPDPEQLIRRLDPARSLSGFREFEPISDPMTAPQKTQRAIAVRVSEFVARATLSIFTSEDDGLAAEFLATLEKMKASTGRRRFGRSRTSSSDRAGRG